MKKVVKNAARVFDFELYWHKKVCKKRWYIFLGNGIKKVCKKQLKVDFDNPEGQYEYEYVFKQHVSVANPPSKKCGSESEEEEDLGS